MSQVEPSPGGRSEVIPPEATPHAASPRDADPHAGLNDTQRRAALFGDAPLLVIAGAGAGKTHTLAHRVAALLVRGADPRRLLLLTFTRRAAAEMTRRAERIATSALKARATPGAAAIASALTWAGTFHAVGNRILRLFAEPIGLDPAFTVLDRGDAEDLLDLVRHDLGYGAQDRKRTRGAAAAAAVADGADGSDGSDGANADAHRERRFPRKGTCYAIYSRVVNAQLPLDRVLEDAFPWCAEWEPELRRLFSTFVEAKQKRHVLDYDDLLLWWSHLMSEPSLAARVGERFDHVLVDEYQDTNALQANILERLRPDGRGVTVVGDDAQAIYSFRAATVRNILDFPARFSPPAAVITLDRSYRSTQPVLDAANAVIALASERFTKDLWSTTRDGARPRVVTVEDETDQVTYVADRVLAARETGLALRQQAVLFRASHHSDALEVELAHRNIPFVKYGGLKFLEAAHVKDVLSILRWAENPRDQVAAFRVLKLLPGMGPAAVRKVWDRVEKHLWDLDALAGASVPARARGDWPKLARLFGRLTSAATPWVGQLGLVREVYEPHMERLYESVGTRSSDLAELEALAAGHQSRERFLSDLTLDPPEGTGAEAGPPHLDEDYLILSTIHSAKGQEWEAVTVINVTDGCIPSDMATGSPEEIEEERRLLYVAMTRAKTDLALVHPLRYFVRHQNRYGDKHVWAPRSRFLPEDILGKFDREAIARSGPGTDALPDTGAPVRVDVAAKLRGMWG